MYASIRVRAVGSGSDTAWSTTGFRPCPTESPSQSSRNYAWQDEFRLAFSLTDALAFENVALALTRTDAAPATRLREHAFYDVAVGSLRDLSRVHGEPPGDGNQGCDRVSRSAARFAADLRSRAMWSDGSRRSRP